MSWEEMYRCVNDDFTEPLNYHNYISDISTFKEDSYVLDQENERLWRNLLTKSLVMFGHKAIHDVVYNRMTAEDVDYMLRNNARLGQTFNVFYRFDGFVGGDRQCVADDYRCSI